MRLRIPLRVMLRVLALFALLGSWLSPALPSYSSVAAQGAVVEIQDLGILYHFGLDITFSVQLKTDAKVRSAAVFIIPPGQAAIREEMTIHPDLTAQHTLALADLGLRPFITLLYRYEVTLDDDQQVQSDQYAFQYDDNRFAWQTAQADGLQTFWYGRDASFGADALTAARDGLKQAGGILPVPPPSPIKIYIYASLRDLQTAWISNNQPWVAGYAEPDLAQVLISIPTGPDQSLELQRQIPHEILHVLQYQVMGDQLPSQPVWLTEGMASLAELYPNPEYHRVMVSAVNNGRLAPIKSYCSSFPREVSGAFMAYAESESFTRFLYKNYGSSGLRRLMDQYRNGLGCEEGVSAALGVSLGQLEYRWKQESLGIDAAQLVLSNLAPYLILLGIGLLVFCAALLPSWLRKPRTA